MPAYEVLLKQVEPLLVASVREVVSIDDDLEQRFGRISSYLEQQGVQQAQPGLLLRHSRYELQDDGVYADVELAVPLPTALPGNEQISIRALPGGLMACTVHTGDDLSLGQAYAALYRWMKEHGYRFSAAPRQVQLQRAGHLDPDQYVTEVQFPAEKQ